MVEYESVKYFNRGVTLLEVMISLIIFSSLVGLSSKYVNSVTNRPFIMYRVEPCLVFMERVSQALEELPDDSNLLQDGVHDNPFPDINQPRNIKSLRLEWIDNNLERYGTAKFTATTNLDKTIEWYVNKEKP